MTATFDPTLRSSLDLTGGAGEPARASENKPRERDERDELWAFAVAETLLQLPRWRQADADPEPAPAGSPPAPRAADARSTDALQRGATPPETAHGSMTNGVAGASGDKPVERLTTELSDVRLGRLELTVARGVSGLNIVINVADAHVKALIEADREALVKSLQDCGLRVASVRVGQSESSGTELAREGTERARANPALPKQNARWRAYRSSLDEENDADEEGVDLTA
jgi:hypothetical protein